jgi:hypothetical protein
MIRDPSSKEEAHRMTTAFSMNQSELSEKKSLKSMDRLIAANSSGKVFSEKCLLNNQDLFKFKGTDAQHKQEPLFQLGKRSDLDVQETSSCDNFQGIRPRKRVKSNLFGDDFGGGVSLRNFFKRKRRKRRGFVEEYFWFWVLVINSFKKFVKSSIFCDSVIEELEEENRPEKTHKKSLNSQKLMKVCMRDVIEGINFVIFIFILFDLYY